MTDIFYLFEEDWENQFNYSKQLEQLDSCQAHSPKGGGTGQRLQSRKEGHPFLALQRQPGNPHRRRPGYQLGYHISTS